MVFPTFFKGNLVKGKKYLQIIYLIGGQQLKYIKNSYNATAKQNKKSCIKKKKMSRGSEETFSQTFKDSQQVHEKVLNITNHQGEAD